MLLAKPSDFQRLAVIVVMLLHVWTAAHFANLWNNFAATLVLVGVGAAVHLDALVRGERVQGSPRSVVSGSALLAIGLKFTSDKAAWIAALTKQGRHPPVLRKQG
jgi:hypothetical protein